MCMATPFAKDISEGSNGIKLYIAGDRWCIFESTRETMEAVDYAVFRSDSGLSDGVVADFNRVRDDDRLGFGIDGFLAAVMLKRDTNTETMFPSGIPRFAGARIFVNDDGTVKRYDVSGIIIKWTVEVLPSRDCWIESILTKKVEGELSLFEEKVLEVIEKVR